MNKKGKKVTAKKSKPAKKTAVPAKKATVPIKKVVVEAAVVKKNPGSFKHFQDLLSRKREDILKTVKGKEVDLSNGDVGDEADVASQTFEREMMFEMTNGERMVLDDIEAALRKIEKSEFGLCESCHKKITHERLKALPWVRYCIECQTRTESPVRA